MQRFGLPVWKTEADVAAALGVAVKELRFFSIHREAERVVHYVRFAVPDAVKTGMKDGAVPMQVVVTHPRYQAVQAVPDADQTDSFSRTLDAFLSELSIGENN